MMYTTTEAIFKTDGVDIKITEVQKRDLCYTHCISALRKS